ncbi:MAG: pyrroline-5-carboxylate reductase [Clostridia bacterium]|nr:pyrroline-5-carboxylate reductase [Clostridia bacterium]
MKYGFIGCGNMGGALAAAAARSVGGSSLLLADADPQKAAALAETLGAAAATNQEIAESCDYIILGVKPQVMGKVLKELPIKGNPVMVSMAAGLKIESLKEMLGQELPWIRMMPNTPVQVGEGRILYASEAEPEQTAGFCRLFAHAGKLLELEEKLIDAGSALSGCGPAFVYQFIEALADGGVACGLPRAIAMELAAGTVLGSAKTVLETGAHPGALKDAVCSPGGSTIMGVKALEDGGFRSAAINAVTEAYHKTKELGEK